MATKTLTPPMRRQEVEDRALEVLKRHGLLSIPVDPVDLAGREGISVNNAVFSDEGVSGMVARRGPHVTFLINQNDPPYRKRFTIAHELGHHFLHLTTDEEVVDRTVDLFRFSEPAGEDLTPFKRREIQANQFAAGILMPDPLVREAYSDAPEIKTLARLFNVSEEAMAIRLNTLGLT